MKKKVIFGFLGSKLDSGATEKRWERWRPTVSLVAHPDFPVSTIELFLTSSDHEAIAEQVTVDIKTVSPATQVNAHLFDIKDPWDFPSVYAALHDFARTYEFSDDTDYFVHLATGTHVAQICLFLLTESRHFPAKMLDTFSHGSAEAWKGRIGVIDLNLTAYDQLASRFSNEREEGAVLLKGGIATRNERFNQLISNIEKVALRSSAPILLTGPTGAGKSQLAGRIYELRVRRHLVSGPFVEVNCATLRGDNAMSALFGHKKGAFTGATGDRPGLLKSADKGILFLDEIGELGLDEQAMLLRALEDKRFLPMGADKEAESDFQLIAGTNKDLNKEVAEGRFREDLFARINLWTFQLPGLAERVEDVEPNLAFECDRAARELGHAVSFNAQARERYLEFALNAPWPGNFRALGASILRMATLAEGGRIVLADVESEVQKLQRLWGTNKSEAIQESGTKLPNSLAHLPMVNAVLPNATLDIFDQAQLETVLGVIKASKSMADAGRQLFSVSREERKSVNDTDRVRKYLARFGLVYDDIKIKLNK